MLLLYASRAQFLAVYHISDEVVSQTNLLVKRETYPVPWRRRPSRPVCSTCRCGTPSRRSRVPAGSCRRACTPLATRTSLWPSWCSPPSSWSQRRLWSWHRVPRCFQSPGANCLTWNKNSHVRIQGEKVDCERRSGKVKSDLLRGLSGCMKKRHGFSGTLFIMENKILCFSIYITQPWSYKTSI